MERTEIDEVHVVVVEVGALACFVERSVGGSGNTTTESLEIVQVDVSIDEAIAVGRFNDFHGDRSGAEDDVDQEIGRKTADGDLIDPGANRYCSPGGRAIVVGGFCSPLKNSRIAPGPAFFAVLRPPGGGRYFSNGLLAAVCQLLDRSPAGLPSHLLGYERNGHILHSGSRCTNLDAIQLPAVIAPDGLGDIIPPRAKESLMARRGLFEFVALHPRL